MHFLRLLVVLFFLNICSLTVYANTESPDQIVKQTVDKVLRLLADENLNEAQKKNEVFELVKQRINFKEMSRRILAINWNKVSEEQKTKFIALFEQTLLNTYWVRLKHYTGEQVEFVATSYDGDDYATVDTVILKNENDVEVPITYRMKRFVDVWYAYDFTVEHLSLVQSYRNEYRAIVKNFDIDGLLEYMQREINNFNSNKN